MGVCQPNAAFGCVETTMPGPLAMDRETIGELCRKHGVRSLVVFGSTRTERFDDTRSDVDSLVESAEDLTSRFDAYLGLEEGLEVLLGRPVDGIPRTVCSLMRPPCSSTSDVPRS